MALPTSLSEPPHHIHAFRSANFPMFRKLQCGCNPVLNLHLTSFCGSIPLNFLYNVFDEELSFVDTSYAQFFVAHAPEKSKKELAQRLEEKVLSTRYKPAFKKHSHGEYHQTNLCFYPAETLQNREMLLDTVTLLLELEQSKNRSDALVYILPCHACYPEANKHAQKNFLWNILHIFEGAENVNVSFFILVDHMDVHSDVDHFKETMVSVQSGNINKKTLGVAPHGILCPVFDNPAKNADLLNFYQLNERDTLFLDVSLQYGFGVETAFATIQETLFKKMQ